MLAFYIYLASIVDSFNIFIFIICGFGGALLVIMWIAYLSDDITDSEGNEGKIERHLKKFSYLCAILIMISIFSPSKETLYMMYIIPKIQNVKGIQDIPSNLVSYINNFLEKNKEKKGS